MLNSSYGPSPRRFPVNCHYRAMHCRMDTFAIEAMDEKAAAALFKNIYKPNMETINRHSTCLTLKFYLKTCSPMSSQT